MARLLLIGVATIAPQCAAAPFNTGIMKPIVFEKVSLAEAKRVHDGNPRAGWRDDWTSRRAANEDEPLDAAALPWMESLPPAIRPQLLARQFTRIANRICALWNQPARCSSYLTDLLIIRRTSRQGFPIAVAREIGNLSVYFETLYPVGRAWTDAR
jgi:hypothetical protein